MKLYLVHTINHVLSNIDALNNKPVFDKTSVSDNTVSIICSALF